MNEEKKLPKKKPTAFSNIFFPSSINPLEARTQVCWKKTIFLFILDNKVYLKGY